MRLVHLTDPHLTTLDGVRFSGLRGKRWSGYLSWSSNRRRKYLPPVLQVLCDAVRAEGADQVLLTGDLAQIGLEQEIDQSARWLESLGPPGSVMLVPGNHDAYAPDSAALFRRAWADYLFHGRSPGEQDFPVLRRLGGLSLVGLSSAVVTPVFMAGGRLGAAQLKKFDAMLAQAASERQLVLMLIHHPPLPGMTRARKALADARELQAVLERHPPMLVFHGHLHHNRERCHGASRIFCTAAASSVSDASYRVIDIHQQAGAWAINMKLKTIAIDAAGQLNFATADEQSWDMSR
jgi:3',5'-cyclic AMP phosphodiesterase CpdA